MARCARHTRVKLSQLTLPVYSSDWSFTLADTNTVPGKLCRYLRYGSIISSTFSDLHLAHCYALPVYGEAAAMQELVLLYELYSLARYMYQV